ncbi:unnamed protein product [Rhizoctonia solani]|uniref:Plasma membrane proteolipid 3 n=1 Tax=Rhizoctonia solani TaxID=456999 RepID=A0A8H3CAF1_9AGAM|nr:unnamed protein product [Rhizoctonia solani]
MAFRRHVGPCGIACTQSPLVLNHNHDHLKHEFLLFNMVKGSDIILILVTILFPPAAVAIMSGCSCDLLINLCLTILGYIPGHIHAFYLIWRRMEAEERYGAGGFQYVGNGHYEPLYVATHQQPQQPNYGSTNYQ